MSNKSERKKKTVVIRFEQKVVKKYRIYKQNRITTVHNFIARNEEYKTMNNKNNKKTRKG